MTTATDYTVTSATETIVRYEETGDALVIGESWARMGADGRRRAAVTAANARDTDQLWQCCLAYWGTHKREPAPSTLINYRAAVDRLVAAWGHVNLLAPDDDEPNLYVRALERKLAAPTVRVHLSGVKLLYRAMRWTKAIKTDPWADVRVEKRDRKPAHKRRAQFTEEEVGRLLDRANLVDRALVLLGARCGLRLAEIMALTWADLDLISDKPRLEVLHGKGDKPRDVDLIPVVVETLTALKTEGHEGEFVMPYRHPSRARQRLRRLQQRAGLKLEPGKAVHSLRHAAGSGLYAATRDLVEVQELLGHASINTSRLYVHRADPDRQRRALEKMPALPGLYGRSGGQLAV